MELVELLEQVENRETFLRFVEALRQDVVRHSDEWQNSSIEQYLEASSAWLRDSKRDDQPSWRLFAEVLYAGKIYE